MNSFVLDASITLSWAFEDEYGTESQRVLESLSNAVAVVPGLWILEVTNGLLVAERRGRLQSMDSNRFLSLLHQLPIEIDDITSAQASEILVLARDKHLSAYDAAYLALAIKRGLPLATMDDRLQSSAIASGIAIFPPTE